MNRTKQKLSTRIGALTLALSLALSLLAGCGQTGKSSAGGSSSAGSASSSSTVTEISSVGGVASSTKYSTEIGLDILEAGGNAIDAAVATAFAIGVAEPEMSGVGGCGIMTIYLKDSNEYTVLEFMETVPKNTVPGVFDPKNRDQADSGMGAAVPGQVHGLLTALEKYGTMERKDVMAPAIKLASEGYELDASLEDYIGMSYDRIIKNEELTSIYTDEGIPKNKGDLIQNPNLANTLQAISDGGIEEFYTGELAEKIVKGLQEDGNPITMEDMAAYQTVEREPLITNYYGYDFIAPPPPASGGMWLLECMNILEEMDIKQYEPNSKEYIHLVTEATRIALIDSANYIGDPAFYSLPDEILVSKDFAKERAQLIQEDKAIPEVIPAELPVEKLGTTAEEGKHTSHIAVMDSYGNIVSLTTTLGNLFGCATAIDGLGFAFNSHMSNMEHDPAKSDSPDYVMPGKRVRTTISPTIIVKDGEPIMAIGSPGSLAIPPAITLVANNALLYGMEIQDAINLPRATATDYGNAVIYIEEGAADEETQQALIDMGYELRPAEDMITSGCIAAVEINNENGNITAGADMRRGYVAGTR